MNKHHQNTFVIETFENYTNYYIALFDYQKAKCVAYISQQLIKHEKSLTKMTNCSLQPTHQYSIPVQLLN